MPTNKGKKITYKFTWRKTAKEPEFIISSVKEKSSAQYFESAMEGFLNLPVLDEITTYDFLGISIGGPNSPTRIGDDIPPTNKRENTPVSKATVTGQLRGH